MNVQLRAIARRLSYAGSGLALMLCLAATAAGAQSDDALSLAQTPLFTSSSVPPNVLVAMDNSGSMDFETLFDTRDGALYWKTDDTNFLRETLKTVGGLLGLDADKTGSFWNSDKSRFVQATGEAYVYLFPNGFNDATHADRRVYNPDDNENQTLLEGLLTPLGLGDLGSLLGGINAPLNLDQLISDLTLDGLNLVLDDVGLLDWYHKFFDYYALPPLPAFAFGRSPDFNKSYFDPTVDYVPWPGFDNANESAAWPDPAERKHPSDRFNLTKVIKNHDAGHRFDIRGGMDLKTSEHGYYCDNCRFGSGRWFDKGKPSGLLSYLLENLLTTIFGSKEGSVGIAYYPATFYLKLQPGTDWTPSACQALLPSGFPYKNGPLEGYGPENSENPNLCGFEITPGTEAMQNFANWFTYYRKRHLAARGGLTSALDSVGGLRFGYMPTSNAIDDETDLSMTDVDYDTDRSSLYNGIYDIDFSEPRGTPNRQSLDFLRIQLEDNASIVQKACQRNLAMVFTDGYNTGSVNGVGNADGNYSPIYDDNKINTIADIAMSGYEDLSTSFSEQEIQDNPVPVPSSCDASNPDPRLDCNKRPHMITSGVTLGQRGTVYDPEQQIALENDVFSGNPPWRNFDPDTLGRAQIDDLWHATINGRGDMLNARTPADIADSFKGVLADMLTNSGSGSDIGVKSGYLGDDSVAYRAGFTSGAWSGDLSARPIVRDSGQLAQEPSWRAARTLIDQDPDARVILATVGQDNGNNKLDAKPFRWNKLKKNQQQQLNDDATLLDYIRGDQSNEQTNGGSYRNRGDNILGDIVHSTPLYVGAPSRIRYPVDWDDRLQDGNETTPEDTAGSYQDFMSERSARTSMIYVGGNDGMLHGFDAASGVEKLAYVPYGVLDNLAKLSEPGYNHRYYVDGTPISGDVVYGGQWHTVLVGGLRAGGRSIYALNVTDPSSFSENSADDTVLWEFTDNKLGYTYGTPSIVRLHNGKWATLFGNGYNNGDEANAKDDTAGMFVVEISNSTNPGSTWIPTNAGGSGPNGLGEVFPVDIDGDFITDYAYAGDLQGNLWRFDLTDTSSANWAASKVFTARDAQDNTQPITSQPQIGAHRYGLDYGVMVYFGTGKYLEDSDRTSSLNNSFYGIWDPGVFSATATDATKISGAASRTDLLAQTVMLEKDSSGQTYRAVTNESIDYTPDSETPAGDYDRGWLLDLPADGERVVSNAQLQGGSRGKNYTVAFSTLTPGTPTACGAAGGGFFMVLNQLNGGRTEKPIFDLNGDNMFNPTDDTLEKEDGTSVTASGVRIRGGIPGAATHQSSRGDGKAYYIIPTTGGSTDGSTTTINIPLLGKDGRVNWREIRR